jgi:hypothetical protein
MILIFGNDGHSLIAQKIGFVKMSYAIMIATVPEEKII